MPDQERGRLDNAIDRAVRGMMQVDPRPGLRHRVAERLHRPARRSLWIVPAFGTAALAVGIVAAALFMRSPQPQPALDHPVASVPSPVLPAPAPRRAATPETPAPPGSARTAAARAESIFGPRRDRVSAASVAITERPAAALPGAGASDLSAELPAFPPIAIPPIELPPIAVSPLIVSPVTIRR